MGGGWTGGWEAGPGIAPAGGRGPGPLEATGGDALTTTYTLYSLHLY